MLSKSGEIRRDEACLDFAGTDVILYPCHGGKGNQVRFFIKLNNHKILMKFSKFSFLVLGFKS